MAKKKYRVYVEFSTSISTDVMADSAEEARDKIDKTYDKTLEHLGGRKYTVWDLHGGVKKVCEVRKRTEEYEQKITIKNKE